MSLGRQDGARGKTRPAEVRFPPKAVQVQGGWYVGPLAYGIPGCRYREAAHRAGVKVLPFGAATTRRHPGERPPPGLAGSRVSPRDALREDVVPAALLEARHLAESPYARMRRPVARAPSSTPIFSAR